MTNLRFSRRRLLGALSAAGIGTVAGCSGSEESVSSTLEQADTLHVAPDGSDDNPGTEDAPLASIRSAVKTARLGQTVYVHAGEYFEFVSFNEPGEPGAPITLTGPADAVLRPPDDIDHAVIGVFVSHIRITGLTISGRYRDREPGNPDSYVPAGLVSLNGSPEDAADYLEGLVISPHGIGESGGALINSVQIKDCDIGGFKVTGPAGAEWLYDDNYDHHYGEIVYLGTAPDNRVESGYEEYDRTRNIRVHHIDNSEGHPHSELVDCKAGVENITIEYCTDAGGAQADDTWNQPGIKLDGRDVTVRWNIINGVQGDGIQIGPQNFMSDMDFPSQPGTDFEKQFGKDNAIYGNVLTDYTLDAVNFLRESIRPGRETNPAPADQRALCDNRFDGYSDADPGESCPTDVPAGDGVGHLGGDSPWSGGPTSAQNAFTQYANGLYLDVTVHVETIPRETPFEIPITVANSGDDPADIALGVRFRARELANTEGTVPAGETREYQLTGDNLPPRNKLVVSRNDQKVAIVRITDND